MRTPHGSARAGWSVAVILASVAALAMSGCGSNKSSSGTTSSSSASTGDPVSLAKDNVEAAYKATSGGFDPAGPAAQKGKKVFYLSAGTSSPDGTEGAAAARKYAKALGWDITVFDGKFSTQVYQEGIREAISQKVDGLLMYGIDCATTKKALEQARAADIKISAWAGEDCNQNNPDQKPLFDTGVTHPGGANDYEFYEQAGKIQADWIIAKTDGKAKVIQFAVPEFAVTAATDKGFNEEFAKCSGCEVVGKVDVLIDDFGPKLQEKAQQALLQHPEANAVEVNYDDLLTLGVAPAVVSSGRNDKLDVIAGNGSQPALDLIRKNKGNDAGYSIIVEWSHAAGFDALNRLFSGDEPAETGEPVTLYDTDHNLGTSGKFDPEFDFERAFEKIWSGQGK